MTITMEGCDHEYDGFISYSHADRHAATRIQRFLERYRLPDRDSRLRVFLDDTDIRSGTLSSGLEEALSRSRSLIVCCSPSAADAKWVHQEIVTFQAQGGGRPIVLVLLSGHPEEAIPAPLQTGDLRYSDLRSAWLFGWMRPYAQIELVRAVATIADVDLRSLVPWDARRRRRNAILGGAITAGVVATAALFPFDYTSEIALPETAATLKVPEYCDVIDARLTLTARERMEGPQGERNYVALYSDILGSDAGDWKWLDDTQYSPTRRLLHVEVVQPETLKRAQSALDMPRIRNRAQAEAAKLEEAHELSDGETVRFLRSGVWIGEPSPGLFVALYAIHPFPIDPADAAIEAPPAGSSVVGVARSGESTRIAVVDRLYPPPPSEHWFNRRSANINDGLPIAVLGDELWIGMPVREDGGLGGLWHSVNKGASWEALKVSGSVSSLLSDPKSERLLLATAPGRWDGGVREGVYDTRLLQRKRGDEDWTLLMGPPYLSDSDVQFCGFMEDGTLATRVARKIFATGRYNLLRILIGE